MRHISLFKRVLRALLMLLIFAPIAQAEEQVDFTACITGTLNFLSTSEGVNAFGVENRGIIFSNPENQLFHNSAYHFMGVGYGPTGQPIGFGYFKITDSDEQIVIAEFSGLPSDLSFKFLQGTGKWKGITGGGKAARIAVGRPIVSGTTQGCVRFTGVINLKQ